MAQLLDHLFTTTWYSHRYCDRKKGTKRCRRIIVIILHHLQLLQ